MKILKNLSNILSVICVIFCVIVVDHFSAVRLYIIAKINDKIMQKINVTMYAESTDVCLHNSIISKAPAEQKMGQWKE